MSLLTDLISSGQKILSGNTGIAGTAGDPPPLITGTIDIGGGSTASSATADATTTRGLVTTFAIPIVLGVLFVAGIVWVVKKAFK